MKQSQNDFLTDLFRQGQTISRVEAMHYGIMNLTARITDLRNSGIDVRCRTKYDLRGNRYGEFYVAAPATIVPLQQAAA